MANLRAGFFSIVSGHSKTVLVAILWVLGTLSVQAAEAPLFSIKPLAMLYQALAVDTSEAPKILLSADKNLHDYQLTVEDMRSLQSSSSFYYFGSEANLSKLSLRLKTNNWHQLVGHSDHAWLNKQALFALIKQLSGVMQKQQPSFAKHIQQRQQTLLRQLDQRFDYWKSQLSAYSSEPLLLGHTAFSMFAKDLGLQHVEIYRSGHSHGHKADGMHDLMSLQKEIAVGQIRCAVEEPDISFAKLQARYPDLELISLEPMGQSIELSDKAFVRYIDTTAAAIYQCLTGGV